jgi:hypothetical protein
MTASPSLHRRAAQVWAFRAGAEREAARRFARLGERLADVGAQAVVVEMARDAANDEVRHAQLCVDLAARFGVAAPPDAGRTPGEVAPSGLTARERVLYEVVAMSCITETLSAALLGEMQDRAADPEVQRTVHEILRDEVQHSRLGWAHLAAEHARGCGRVLGDYLPAMLAGTVTEELFRAGSAESEAAPALAGYGALARADRAQIFAATMRELVFVGLERFGVDTSAGARWLEEKLGQQA